MVCLTPSRTYNVRNPEEHHPKPTDSVNILKKDDSLSLPSSIEDEGWEEDLACTCSRKDPVHNRIQACDTMLNWIRLTFDKNKQKRSNKDIEYSRVEEYKEIYEEIKKVPNAEIESMGSYK